MADENLLTVNLPNIVSIVLMWAVGVAIIGLIVVLWAKYAPGGSAPTPVASPG